MREHYACTGERQREKRQEDQHKQRMFAVLQINEVVLIGAIHFDRKEEWLPHSPGHCMTSDTYQTFVCPHVRWAGLPWVVISKTLGKLGSGLKPKA